MKNTIKQAFSLIELLVTLIIISLLIGAFTPIITKKLKASDVAVGSFSAGSKNDNSNNIDKIVIRDVTEEDCKKIGALYISAQINGGKNICVTKYNVGDGDIPIADTVNVSKTGVICQDKENCCYQGTTSNNCGGTNGDSSYNPCTRTVCGWKAAYDSCEAYKTNPGGRWRLPTFDEYSNWGKNFSTLQFYKGVGGLQLCDGHQNYTNSMFCNYHNTCLPTEGNYSCWPHDHWTNNVADATGQNYYSAELDLFKSNNFIKKSFSKRSALSTRCVLDMIVEGVEEPKQDDDGLEYREPKNQADCDPYDSMFLDKKYVGGEKNLCMMRYNMGDGTITRLTDSDFWNVDAGVLSVAGGVAGNQYWCWKYSGSSNANQTGTGGTFYTRYRGTARTVCAYGGANLLCGGWHHYKTREGYWRLLNSNEAKGLVETLKTETADNHSFNRWLQIGGLNLCNEGNATDGLERCASVANCKSVMPSNNRCYPSYVWVSPQENGSGYYFGYNGASLVNSSIAIGNALSVRCVTDKILK